MSFGAVVRGAAVGPRLALRMRLADRSDGAGEAWCGGKNDECDRVETRRGSTVELVRAVERRCEGARPREPRDTLLDRIYVDEEIPPRDPCAKVRPVSAVPRRLEEALDRIVAVQRAPKRTRATRIVEALERFRRGVELRVRCV